MKTRTKRKSPAGRKPLPKDRARSRLVTFRAEPPFYARLEAVAKKEGKPLATWLYDALKTLLEGN